MKVSIKLLKSNTDRTDDKKTRYRNYDTMVKSRVPIPGDKWMSEIGINEVLQMLNLILLEEIKIIKPKLLRD